MIKRASRDRTNDGRPDRRMRMDEEVEMRMVMVMELDESVEANEA